MRFRRTVAGRAKKLHVVTVAAFMVTAVAVLAAACGSAKPTVGSVSVPEAVPSVTTTSLEAVTTSTLSMHERIQQERAAQEKEAVDVVNTTASVETTSTQSTFSTSTTATPTTGIRTTSTPTTAHKAVLVLGDGRRLSAEQMDDVNCYLQAMKPLVAEQGRIYDEFAKWVNLDILDSEVWKEARLQPYVDQRALCKQLDSISPPSVLYQEHEAMTTAGHYYRDALGSTGYQAYALFQKGVESAQEAERLMEEFNYLLDSAHWE